MTKRRAIVMTPDGLAELPVGDSLEGVGGSEGALAPVTTSIDATVIPPFVGTRRRTFSSPRQFTKGALTVDTVASSPIVVAFLKNGEFEASLTLQALERFVVMPVDISVNTGDYLTMSIDGGTFTGLFVELM